VTFAASQQLTKTALKHASISTFEYIGPQVLLHQLTSFNGNFYREIAALFFRRTDPTRIVYREIGLKCRADSVTTDVVTPSNHLAAARRLGTVTTDVVTTVYQFCGRQRILTAGYLER
jgi:hypothetical protein